jgi:hypothetical protein
MKNYQPQGARRYTKEDLGISFVYLRVLRG